MSLRKILIAAAVAVPLALSPVQASAQQGRGAEAREHAHEIGGQTVTQLPPGIAQRVERGGTVPPGIARRYEPQVAEAPLPEAEPEQPEQPEEPEQDPNCFWVPVAGPDFTWMWVQDSCTGELMPLE